MVKKMGKKHKKRLVVIGAFNRYNYGDNLMPVLFEMFLNKFYPNVSNNYDIIYSALTDSDLSRYKAKKTISMSKVFNNKKNAPYAIISIGGEVLCASSSTLFLYMDNPYLNKKIVVALRKAKLKIIADLFCKSLYKLPWEYPYIPPKSKKTLTALNTVGGSLNKTNISLKINKITERLSAADYFSARDTRLLKSSIVVDYPEVLPDSAIVMADLASDEFLMQESSESVNSLKDKKYLCFQVSPIKSDASAAEWAKILKKISEKYNLDIVLCPIGYANGHNDVDILREINKESSNSFKLLYDLNLWEIMSVIKNSKIFLGTSLHGAITALSFAVPNIGLNPKIDKLDSFLEKWGFGASKRCYSSYEILDIIEPIMNMSGEEFSAHCSQLRQLGAQNNHKLINALDL